MTESIDRVFPVEASDMARGDHYEQTGHFTWRDGVCVSCAWMSLPATERQKLIIAGYQRAGYVALAEEEMYALGFGQSG